MHLKELKNKLDEIKDIYVKNIGIVDDNFHARYQATKKSYQYVININEFNPLNKNYCYYYKYNVIYRR